MKALKELALAAGILALALCTFAFLFYMVSHYKVTAVETVIYEKGGKR